MLHSSSSSSNLRFWTGLGAFYPYSRNHNGNHFRDQDPAQWPLVADVSKKALAIRYRLLPYLYALFDDANWRGSTVIRPLHHEFPREEATYDIQDQFLWGSSLMIAPVVYEGARQRQVYFPDATWYDLNGQKVVMPSRPATLTVPMPIDHIGVYYRGGTVFPAQAPGINTAQSRNNPFHFIAALDERRMLSQAVQAVGQLYWDDGESIDPVVGGRYIDAQILVEARENPLFGRPYVQVSYRTNYGGTPFDGNDARVNQIFIYGVEFSVTNVTQKVGLEGSARVSQIAGVTTVTFSAPIAADWDFFLV